MSPSAEEEEERAIQEAERQEEARRQWEADRQEEEISAAQELLESEYDGETLDEMMQSFDEVRGQTDDCSSQAPMTMQPPFSGEQTEHDIGSGSKAAENVPPGAEGTGGSPKGSPRAFRSGGHIFCRL